MASNKARTRRYVPESPGGEAMAKLEARFLADPLFFRFPEGSAGEKGDQVYALAQGLGQTGTNQHDSGEYTVTATGTASNANGQIAGTSTSTIVDSEDPDLPAPP